MGILATFFRIFGEDTRSLENHMAEPRTPRAGFEDLHTMLTGENEKPLGQVVPDTPALKR